jgi:hypothetical protein
MIFFLAKGFIINVFLGPILDKTNWEIFGDFFFKQCKFVLKFANFWEFFAIFFSISQNLLSQKNKNPLIVINCDERKLKSIDI